MRDLDSLFVRLATSRFRSRFRLGEKEHTYLATRGLPIVLDHAADCRKTARTCRTSRSEEHTSELQSLMRTSYAVSCLKKKQSTNELLIPLQSNEITTEY